MKLQLVTLRGIKMDDEVYQVVLPTENGQITVLPGHESLVTLAIPGVVTVKREKLDKEDAMDVFAINGGIVEIDQSGIRILVDEADAAADLVEDAERAAHQAALELKARAKTQLDLDEAQAEIDRTAVRLQLASLRRRR